MHGERCGVCWSATECFENRSPHMPCGRGQRKQKPESNGRADGFPTRPRAREDIFRPRRTGVCGRPQQLTELILTAQTGRFSKIFGTLTRRQILNQIFENPGLAQPCQPGPACTAPLADQFHRGRGRSDSDTHDVPRRGLVAQARCATAPDDEEEETAIELIDHSSIHLYAIAHVTSPRRVRHALGVALLSLSIIALQLILLTLMLIEVSHPSCYESTSCMSGQYCSHVTLRCEDCIEIYHALSRHGLKGGKLPGNLKTGSVITGELPVIILPGNYRVT
jgi:hypothetical protein